MRSRTLRNRVKVDPDVRDVGIVFVATYGHPGVLCTKTMVTFRFPDETIDVDRLRCEGCARRVELHTEDRGVAEISEKAGVLRWRVLGQDASGNDVPKGPWRYVPLGRESIPLVVREELDKHVRSR